MDCFVTHAGIIRDPDLLQTRLNHLQTNLDPIENHRNYVVKDCVALRP